MKNESEYDKIISLIPKSDLKFIKPYAIREAVKGGFIRYFLIEHTEQKAELMANDRVIIHGIEKVTLDIAKKNIWIMGIIVLKKRETSIEKNKKLHDSYCSDLIRLTLRYISS
ncbi:hypothetical protein QM565_19415 [Geitlerinema splendidum]|nr:hypothetical protein [Geitlerinema splendidum]